MRSPVPNHLIPLASRYISLKNSGSLLRTSSSSSALAPYAMSRVSHPCLRGRLYSCFSLLIKLSGALLQVRFLILCFSSLIDFLGSQESRIFSRFFQQPYCRRPMNKKLSSKNVNFLLLFAQLTIGY